MRLKWRNLDKFQSFTASMIGFSGDCLTWSNRHQAITFTKERLDRAMANPKKTKNYNWTKVENMVSRCSDHKPIQLFYYQKNPRKMMKGRLFRFEYSWNLNVECSTLVQQCWSKFHAHANAVNKVEVAIGACYHDIR